MIIMKNLFLINEEEKNRILNLHINASNRLYLNENEKTNYSAKGNLIDILKKENLVPDHNKRLMNPNNTYVIINSSGPVKVAGNSNNLVGKQFKNTDFIDLTGGGRLIFHELKDKKFHYIIDTEGVSGIRIYGSWN